MTQYTHPGFDGLFPRRTGEFVEIDGVQIGSSFFRTHSQTDIEARGFEVFTAPEPEPLPDPVPQAISRRQIITGLSKAGWITQQEALDALAIGARPAAVKLVISSLPEDDQFDALTKWIGFTEAYRDDPLVLALAAAEGKSEVEIDDFFRMCAAIE